MSLKSRGTVTYSAAFTLVPTNECFNRCTYCNFRRDRRDATRLSLETARGILQSLIGSGVCEILILSGEVHPQSPRRQDWFKRIYDLCSLVLEEGFLPHSNVGPLSYHEMAQLAQVNVSMGLMLEQLSPFVQQKVHAQAPSKAVSIRLQQLQWAGELKIPFTTGLLFGIGETEQEWSLTLEAIANSHHQWGHIQEVILQPYQPGQLDPYQQSPFPLQSLLKAIERARAILPDSISLQIPPNLISSSEGLLKCLEAGATDLGGIVPLDHVNPDYQHLEIESLSEQLQQWGYHLTERLPVYQPFVSLLSEELQAQLSPWLSGQQPLGYLHQRSLSSLSTRTPMHLTEASLMKPI